MTTAGSSAWPRAMQGSSQGLLGHSVACFDQGNVSVPEAIFLLRYNIGSCCEVWEEKQIHTQFQNLFGGFFCFYGTRNGSQSRESQVLYSGLTPSILQYR